jgi:hypothetical protein
MKNNKINYEELIQKAAAEGAKLGAREAIKEYKTKEMEEKRSKIFHNTRLLMSNYTDLKKHSEKGIDSLKFAINNGDYDTLSEDEIYILSIKQSKARTLVMIAHIDMALNELKKRQAKEGTIEKYRALEMFFINEKSYEYIQEKLNCGKNTPGRWVKEMIDELSVLLFGVDGLKIDLIG